MKLKLKLKKFTALLLASVMILSMLPDFHLSAKAVAVDRYIDILINAGTDAEIFASEIQKELHDAILKELTRRTLLGSNNPEYLDPGLLPKFITSKPPAERDIDVTDGNWYIYDHYDTRYWAYGGHDDAIKDLSLNGTRTSATITAAANAASFNTVFSPQPNWHTAFGATDIDGVQTGLLNSRRPYFPNHHPATTGQAHMDRNRLKLSEWVESPLNVNGLKTIMDRAGATNYPAEEILGTFDRHIYARNDVIGGIDTSIIDFVGYCTYDLCDYMLYPNASREEKIVTFNVNGANANCHSMKGAGFLVNAHIQNNGLPAEKGYPGRNNNIMSGYVLYYIYPNVGTEANAGKNMAPRHLALFRIMPETTAQRLHGNKRTHADNAAAANGTPNPLERLELVAVTDSHGNTLTSHDPAFASIRRDISIVGAGAGFDNTNPARTAAQANALHAATGALRSGDVRINPTLVANTNYWTQMDVKLEITPTSLKVYQKEEGVGTFDGKEPVMEAVLDDLGIHNHGFGPIVAYTQHGHNCARASQFTFTDISLSFIPQSDNPGQVVDENPYPVYPDPESNNNYFVDLTQNGTNRRGSYNRFRQNNPNDGDVLYIAGKTGDGTNKDDDKDALIADLVKQIINDYIKAATGQDAFEPDDSFPYARLQLSKRANDSYDGNLLDNAVKIVERHLIVGSSYPVFAYDTAGDNLSLPSDQRTLDHYYFRIIAPDGSIIDINGGSATAAATPLTATNTHYAAQYQMAAVPFYYTSATGTSNSQLLEIVNDSVIWAVGTYTVQLMVRDDDGKFSPNIAVASFDIITANKTPIIPAAHIDTDNHELTFTVFGDDLVNGNAVTYYDINFYDSDIADAYESAKGGVRIDATTLRYYPTGAQKLASQSANNPAEITLTNIPLSLNHWSLTVHNEAGNSVAVPLPAPAGAEVINLPPNQSNINGAGNNNATASPDGKIGVTNIGHTPLLIYTTGSNSYSFKDSDGAAVSAGTPSTNITISVPPTIYIPVNLNDAAWVDNNNAFNRNPPTFRLRPQGHPDGQHDIDDLLVKNFTPGTYIVVDNSNNEETEYTVTVNPNGTYAINTPSGAPTGAVSYYTLNVIAGRGMENADGSGIYPYGRAVHYSADVRGGFRFSHWTSNASNPYSNNVTGNHTVTGAEVLTAFANKDITIEVNLNTGTWVNGYENGGYILNPPTITLKDTQGNTFTAPVGGTFEFENIPPETYQILADGDSTGRSVTIEADGTISGTALLNYYTLYVNAGPGTQTPLLEFTDPSAQLGGEKMITRGNGNQIGIFFAGTQVSIDASERSGYTFSRWYSSRNNSGFDHIEGQKDYPFQTPPYSLTLTAQAIGSTDVEISINLDGDTWDDWDQHFSLSDIELRPTDANPVNPAYDNPKAGSPNEVIFENVIAGEYEIFIDGNATGIIIEVIYDSQTGNTSGIGTLDFYTLRLLTDGNIYGLTQDSDPNKIKYLINNDFANDLRYAYLAGTEVDFSVNTANLATGYHWRYWYPANFGHLTPASAIIMDEHFTFIATAAPNNITVKITLDDDENKAGKPTVTISSPNHPGHPPDKFDELTDGTYIIEDSLGNTITVTVGSNGPDFPDIELDYYTLTVKASLATNTNTPTINGQDDGGDEISRVFLINTQVDIKALLADDYYFSGWYGEEGDMPVNNVRETTVTITQKTTLIANAQLNDILVDITLDGNNNDPNMPTLTIHKSGDPSHPTDKFIGLLPGTYVIRDSFGVDIETVIVDANAGPDKANIAVKYFTLTIIASVGTNTPKINNGNDGLAAVTRIVRGGISQSIEVALNPNHNFSGWAITEGNINNNPIDPSNHITNITINEKTTLTATALPNAVNNSNPALNVNNAGADSNNTELNADSAAVLTEAVPIIRSVAIPNTSDTSNIGLAITALLISLCGIIFCIWVLRKLKKSDINSGLF